MLRIRELRTEKGLTQEELGKLLNVQKAAVSKYERNLLEPSKSMLIKLSEIFDCSIDYIIGLSNIRNGATVSEEAYLYQANNKENTDDISKSLSRMKRQLMTSDTLMFDGQPATKEQVQAILNAIEMGEAYAKQRAKAKFTPKKYRK